MIFEILRQAWTTLRRSPMRSFLTMLGVAWGIASVALLLAYGSSFRSVLLTSFQAFGKNAIVCWPGQTGEQDAGERGDPDEPSGRVEEQLPLVHDVFTPFVVCARAHGCRPCAPQERDTEPSQWAGLLQSQSPGLSAWLEFAPRNCTSGAGVTCTRGRASPFPGELQPANKINANTEQQS